jgi:hypothetical protein
MLRRNISPICANRRRNPALTQNIDKSTFTAPPVNGLERREA